MTAFEPPTATLTLRQIRERTGMTRAQVAAGIRALGVTKVTTGTIRAYEAGSSRPGKKFLDAWATVLDLEPGSVERPPRNTEGDQEDAATEPCAA
jgi:transcriptional regulator with XRE-family HTH domain